MMTMKKALLTMLVARLKETKDQDPRYDHQYWIQQGRINTLEEIIELVECQKENGVVNREEFKQIFKELCKSGEIRLSLDPHNDGYQWLTFKIDNETIYEDYIDKD